MEELDNIISTQIKNFIKPDSEEVKIRKIAMFFVDAIGHKIGFINLYDRSSIEVSIRKDYPALTKHIDEYVLSYLQSDHDPYIHETNKSISKRIMVELEKKLTEYLSNVLNKEWLPCRVMFYDPAENSDEFCLRIIRL